MVFFFLFRKGETFTLFPHPKSLKDLGVPHSYGSPPTLEEFKLLPVSVFSK